MSVTDQKSPRMLSMSDTIRTYPMCYGRITIDADRARDTWCTVSFPEPFSNEFQPMVLTTIQTYEGNVSPGLRIKDVTRQGFLARFDELITGVNTTDGRHLPEIVGWVALGIPVATFTQNTL